MRQGHAGIALMFRRDSLRSTVSSSWRKFSHCGWAEEDSRWGVPTQLGASLPTVLIFPLPSNSDLAYLPKLYPETKRFRDFNTNVTNGWMGAGFGCSHLYQLSSWKILLPIPPLSTRDTSFVYLLDGFMSSQGSRDTIGLGVCNFHTHQEVQAIAGISGAYSARSVCRSPALVKPHLSL